MFDFVFYDKDDTSVNINDIVSSENNYDNVILDDNNVITVNKLNDERHLFLFKHKKLINNELVEVSNWTLKEYDPKIRDVVIKEQNMFLVQGIKGQINAIYNYEQTKFIVSPGIWSNICYSNNNPKAPKINYIKEYNGLLANLYISTSS